MLGGGGAVVAHGSSGLVPLTQLTCMPNPSSLPHVLFKYGSWRKEYH